MTLGVGGLRRSELGPETRMGEEVSSSLLDGWLHLLIIVLGVAGAAFLLIRPVRWWWIRVVPPVLAVSTVAAWAVGRFVAPHYVGEELKFEIALWVAVGFSAIGLAIGWMFRSTWWQRVLAVVAAVVVVAAAANQINAYYVQFPRLGDLLGAGSASEISGPPVVGPSRATSSSPVPAGPLTTTWTPTGSNIPADGKGRTSTIDLPGTASGFAARPGKVYYPPAYFADNPEPLPVLILIAGQPGEPGDWFLGDRVQNIMDEFAAAHRGIAPVVVVPDALGASLSNPGCFDSPMGNVNSYLAKDVPEGIANQLLVDPDRSHWVIGGFSYGGTCSLVMATNHPDLYRNFIDISGFEDAVLNDGQLQETIDKVAGGDATKFKSMNPKDLMTSKRFDGSGGWFIAGSEDGGITTGMQRLNTIAQAAGMDTQFWASPGTGHDWTTAVNGLTQALPWAAKKMNLTG